MSKLPVYIDFKSPAAWLAFKPLTELAHRRSLSIEWRPYRVRLEQIPEQTADEDTGGRHRRVRAIARRRMHSKYAAIQGIPMNFPDTPCETDLALASLLTLHKKDATNYVHKLFLAFWSHQHDLNDTAIITACSAAAGLGEADFNQPPAAALPALAEHQQVAIEAGIIDTPAILSDNQIFIGREHLPWIESSLGAGSTDL